eukprot:6691616-Alexandrium_andersonii.AAC.1
MSASLVGSEMCIRDRISRCGSTLPGPAAQGDLQPPGAQGEAPQPKQEAVSYTHLTLPTICSV